MDHQELLSGFIRLHVLHHAAEEEIFGQWMIEELARTAIA
jgi:PadR family transcriptional regulator PadR